MEEKQMTLCADATEKLYYKDSHMKVFTAAVVSCEEGKKGYLVVLDRTAFFPEGGGQFGDIGWLNDVEVFDTHEKGGVVYHYTKEPLEVGTIVDGKLDFEVRFSRMQQHTGEHILSGLVHQLYGYDNVGFHLGADVTTLDFNGELTPEQVRELEDRANRAVFADIPVQIVYPTKEELQKINHRSKIEIEGQVRIVSIPGCDICACCAPHMNRTGEVGLIKILACDRHRGGCRMTIVCGMRALADYRMKGQVGGRYRTYLGDYTEDPTPCFFSYLIRRANVTTATIGRIMPTGLANAKSLPPRDSHMIIRNTNTTRSNKPIPSSDTPALFVFG